jgi:hypothetical protein
MTEREVECDGSAVATTDEDRRLCVKLSQELERVVRVLADARDLVRLRPLAPVTSTAVVDDHAPEV